jgi:uncharacterized protein (TIGR00251 family)
MTAKKMIHKNINHGGHGVSRRKRQKSNQNSVSSKLSVGQQYSVVKFLSVVSNEIHIAIKALPGASKTEFAGVQEQRLRVRIAAAPEDGRANAELISFISKSLGCPKKEVRLLRGTQSRIKTIAVPLSYRVQLEKVLEGVQS